MEFDPQTGEVIEDEGSVNGDSGTSIAQMAESGEVLDAPPAIRGDGQLSLDVGGDEPTVSVLQLSLGSIPASQQWEKGEVIRLAVDVRIGEVHFKDVEDPHGFRHTERKHVGKLAHVHVVEN